MQCSRWLLLLIGMVLLWTTTSTDASPSNASPRELKALRQALKKQQRLKEQRSGVKGQTSVGGSGEYVPDAGPWSSTDANEPSCEQLREMWRQSKRHSRAAESTNEIPQYADPFARAAYARQLAAEPTLRPRPERRPVVYGRLHSSPPMDSDDRAPRPFDVLRKLSRPESESGPSVPESSGSGGVVLYSEEDRSPFAKSPAKGSLQHLRELVREEQAGSGVKGSFQQLRDIVREEGQGRLPSGRSDWGDADVGRVVTSPSDHSKYALYATMQGDAPYPESSFVSPSHNGRRPVTGNYNNRLSSFGGKSSHHRNRQQTGSSSMGEEAPRKAQFQLRDPPRPRVGSARLAASRAASSHSRWSDTNEDVGVIRGYVVGRSNNNPLFSSRPSRRSSDAEMVSCYRLVIDSFYGGGRISSPHCVIPVRKKEGKMPLSVVFLPSGRKILEGLNIFHVYVNVVVLVGWMRKGKMGLSIAEHQWGAVLAVFCQHFQIEN